MLGLVLCGGKSSRMGSDKGLLAPGSDNWAKLAKDKLASLELDVNISVNKEQFSSYSTIFPAPALIADDPALSIRGPLCGVLSAYIREPVHDLFVLACDMPLMETFILKELLQTSRSYPEADAFVFSNDGEAEPLCGIYKTQGLASILAMHHSGQLSKHSMKFMLDHLNTFATHIPEENKKFFLNINAHAQLNGL